MANRDHHPNDERDLRNERERERDRERDRQRVDRDRNEANRGYRGGHMSGGAMGNRGALGSGFLGPNNFGGGELIGGGSNAGYGAGGMWPNLDASMDGYSGTMGDETDLGGYGNARPRGGYGGYDTGRPNFAGRGSKNYKRSDTRIEEDVHEALMHDPYLDATDVDVAVKDGEVTLSGEVADRAARRRAEECVERCAGVREIQNNLKARQGLTGRDARE